MTTALDSLQETLAAAVTDVGPSLVGIGHRRGRGSGIVIAPGKVLTNAHNLGRGEVQVIFSDGRSVSGEPLGVDLDGDIAVVGVDTGDAPAISWPEDSHPVAIGTPVVALANPGGHGLRATLGYVSSVERSFRGPRGRRIHASFEHTAPLLPGSSGGPVVSADGGLLGINTNRLGEGFYLAIPADSELRSRVDRLAAGETASRPRLGIGVAPAEVARRLRRAVGLTEVDGLLVRQVEDDSPAADAGIEEGDLITAVAGQAVTQVDDLHGILDSAEAGDLAVDLLRGADERTVTVRLS